jgi:uncharacterized protein
MQVRNVEWVVKISKLCNLRCTYCYEFPFLASRERMSLDDLARMFRHIAEGYVDDPKRMDFVWHGGEPLLIEPDYYHRIADLQHEAFDNVNVPFTNSIQTNLTVLNESTLALLRSGFFVNIGVSFDVFGEQRVDLGGRMSDQTVLKHMQLLRDEGILFGCIVVLSKATAPHIRLIYKFFEEIETSFRLLPIYRTGYEHQQDQLALAPEEIVAVFKIAVDLWLASERNIQVRPIQDYVTHVVWKLDNTRRRHFYDKLKDEVVYIVNTDGSLYSVADPPDHSLCHGNLFSTSLRELKHSAGYLRAVGAAHARMADTCNNCNYYGLCSGYFMGEATPEQRHYDNSGRLECSVVLPVQQYIEHILLDSHVFDPIKGFVRPTTGLSNSLLQDTPSEPNWM